MLVCAFFCANCTRDRGCSAHPAFPAPSSPTEGEKLRRTRTYGAARMRTHIVSSLTIESATIESESRPKPGAFERVAALLRRQRGEERLHGRALLARGHQREIIVLI